MEYGLEPRTCSYCAHKEETKSWDKLLNLMCACGHPFGDHMGSHPHACGNGALHADDHCEEFFPAVTYGPPRPTAEEVYESLRYETI